MLDVSSSLSPIDVELESVLLRRQGRGLCLTCTASLPLKIRWTVDWDISVEVFGSVKAEVASIDQISSEVIFSSICIAESARNKALAAFNPSHGAKRQYLYIPYSLLLWSLW